MRAMMRSQGFHRRPAPPRAQVASEFKTFPAPVRGWVTNENLAASKGASARVLENFFPEFDGVRLRGGSTKVATIGSAPVTAIFTYTQGGLEKIFAASAAAIFDISAFDPDTAPSAAVSSQTDGYYSALQRSTSGGEFLYVFNEADEPQLFDGSTWTQITNASTPAITGTTSSDTSLLRYGWVYRNRIYMVERGSMNVWYLATDAIGGAASQLALQGVFRKGGEVLFGTTWSVADAGDGMDDRLVIFTTLGEVAVFEGADPGAGDWRLIGVYDSSAPLGKNAHTRAGGDVLIATVEGIVPLTEIMTKDPAALSISAVSRPIEPDWKAQARAASGSYPWQLVKWADRNMAIVSLPHTTLTMPEVYVVNLQTGAWAKYTGWDARSMATYGVNCYFGTTDGKVRQMEEGGSDDGDPYVCRLSGSFDHLKAPGAYKEAVLARALFRASVPFNPQLSIAVDYSETWEAAPSAAPDPDVAAIWDSGIWDVSRWDEGGEGVPPQTVNTLWNSITGAGIAHAPQVQVTLGNLVKPDAKLIAFDLAYQRGQMVG